MWFKVQKELKIQGVLVALMLLSVPSFVTAESKITPAYPADNSDANSALPTTPSDENGEHVDEATPTSKVQTPRPSETVMYAILESRPTWLLSRNGLYMANYAEAGVKLPKFSVGYRQQFLNNIFDARGLIGNGNFVFSDGFMRFQKNDILTNPDGISVSWEPRIYLPTDPGKMSQGFLIGMRNYFKVNVPVGKTGLSVLAYEVPIFYLYEKREANGITNPFFENRALLALDYSFFGGYANFQVPVFFNYVVNGDFTYWVYPEFLVKVDTQLKVGMAYQFGTLLDADFTSLAVDGGFQRGITQFILQLRF